MKHPSKRVGSFLAHPQTHKGFKGKQCSSSFHPEKCLLAVSASDIVAPITRALRPLGRSLRSVLQYFMYGGTTTTTDRRHTTCAYANGCFASVFQNSSPGHW